MQRFVRIVGIEMHLDAGLFFKILNRGLADIVGPGIDIEDFLFAFLICRRMRATLQKAAECERNQQLQTTTNSML